MVVDAGTGIYSLGKRLIEQGQKEIHLLISHTHWDHIHGFPYFAPLCESDVTIHLYALANRQRFAQRHSVRAAARAFFLTHSIRSMPIYTSRI